MSSFDFLPVINSEFSNIKSSKEKKHNDDFLSPEETKISFCSYIKELEKRVKEKDFIIKKLEKKIKDQETTIDYCFKELETRETKNIIEIPASKILII